MTVSFTAREVRTWARENDVDCPTTGKIARHVIDAYLLARHGTRVAGDDSVDEPEPDDDSEYAIVLTVPDASSEDVDAICDAVLALVTACVEAGKSIQRDQVMAALGGAA